MTTKVSEGPASSGANAALCKKVNKILQNDIDGDKETLDALRGLSNIVKENTLEARRNLRSDIEKKSITVNEEFVASFGKVKHMLDKLCLDVQDMDRNCRSIAIQLEKATNGNRTMIEEAKKYKEEAEINEIKQTVVSRFYEHFQMGPEKVDLIRSKSQTSNDVINNKFFDSLEIVEGIHGNAKQVLINSNQQKTAIEIMELTALYHEVAFERLYRWTLNSLRSFNPDATAESTLVQRAAKCLQMKPSLLQYALDEYCNVRRAAFVRNFIDALTKGTPSSGGSMMGAGRKSSVGSVPGAQPIDHHANDPLRYIGDILAWLNQNVALEKSQLELLLRECSEVQPLVISCLAMIAEGFSRPAKYRIEQQLITDPSSKKSPGPVTLFKVKALIQFYRTAMSEQLVPEAELVKALEELELLAQRMFLNVLNYHCSNRLGKSSTGDTEMIPDNLSVPNSISATTSLLRQLIAAQNSNPIKDQQDVSEILGVTLNPIVKSVRETSLKLPRVEAVIFQVNCLNELLVTLDLIKEAVQDHVLAVETLVEEQLKILVSEQSKFVVSHLGMSTLGRTIAEGDLTGMASLAGCDALALKAAAKNLDIFLAEPRRVRLPQMDLLTREEHQTKIYSESLVEFVKNYSLICSAISDPRCGYDVESVSFLHHSPENVKALLT